ncbi:TPA: hypothetical protein [Thermocrinis Great Boiling Spring virus]|nr:TPA: hypothetical protein [Thermocrinis Great Boiling Spring virus]
MERAVKLLKESQIITLTREAHLIVPKSFSISRPIDGVVVIKGAKITKVSDRLFILTQDEKKKTTIIWAEGFDVYNVRIRIYPTEYDKAYKYEGFVDDNMYWYSAGVFLEIDNDNQNYVCIELSIQHQECDPIPVPQTFIIRNAEEIVKVPAKIEDVLEIEELL